MSTGIFHRNFIPSDRDALIDFFSKAFPNRKGIKKYIDKILITSFEKGWNQSLLVFKGDEIIGTDIILSNKVSIGDEELPMQWSFDLKVLDEYRTSEAGMHILADMMARKNIFGHSLSPIALDLHKKIRTNFIGSFCGFMKPNRNILCYALNPFSSRFSKRFHIQKEFPQIIQNSSYTFTKCTHIEELHFQENNYWNTNVIEFARSKEFIDWRFFSPDSQYYLYELTTIKSLEQNPYFVCRIMFYKRIPFLYIVDYRFNIEDSQSQTHILHAAIQLARSMNLAGVYTMTSLPTFSKLLKTKGFKSRGNGREIVSRCRIKDILKYPVFFTPADSDCDF